MVEKEVAPGEENELITAYHKSLMALTKDFVSANVVALKATPGNHIINGLVRFAAELIFRSTDGKSKKDIALGTQEFMESVCDFMDVPVEIVYKGEE